MEPPPATSTDRAHLWGTLFWLYTAVLTVGLLWPGLEVPTVVPRPDLIVHGVAFGLFSLLLALWNPVRSTRALTTAAVALVVGAAYGGTTELLQSTPILKRSGAWDDWFADLFGVVCGLALYGAGRLNNARR